MPEALIRDLKSDSLEKVTSSGKYKNVKERRKAYVYGTLDKLKKKGTINE
jgi:hypothetical protein